MKTTRTDEGREEGLNQRALAKWDDEGGHAPAPSSAPAANAYAPCRPALPPGYSAQEAWGFHDPTGRFVFEFCRVYGPPEDADQRGPFCRLNADLSYWVAMWPIFGKASDEHIAGRSMSFGQARKLLGSHLTFQRFSSSVEMREELPRLLHLGDIAIAVQPGFAASWMLDAA
jgi:hypothetical protein